MFVSVLSDACLRRLLVSLAFLFVLLGGARGAYAQCPSMDNIGWPRGATVRFFIEPGMSEEQKRQIRWGLAEWNRANSLNNSRVRFEEDFTGQNFQFHFVNGTLGNGMPAFAHKNFGADGAVVSAVLTYDLNATFPGTNTLIVNPTQTGFDTIIIKLTLHEVGHTMGLDHPPVPAGNVCEQPDGATVMNYICNVNDRSNNMPLKVTECDRNTINSEARYPVTSYPIDQSEFFVRQHYLDFLNREADAGGLQFWTSQIEACGADTECRRVRRVNVSAAFFLSIEFQETGYFVYRVYQAAFGDIPGKPVPITIQELLPESQRVGRGVVVGVGDWRGQLNANKDAWLLELVTRTRFTSLYPPTLSPAQFVDTLNANTGGVLSPAERDALVNELTAASNTPQARARVLRQVAEDPDLVSNEFNSAFVLMQYYGYMRRNPDDPPDPDFSGYFFWLNNLNRFNGDWRRAEMVRAFIESLEYRRRFVP